MSMPMHMAHAMRKRMAHGGRCEAHGQHMCEMCHGGKMMAEGGEMDDGMMNETDPNSMDKATKSIKKAFKAPGYADGGFIEEEDASGYMPDPKIHPDHMYEHAVENQDDHEDMVSQIRSKRVRNYSEGGRVANDTPIVADFEDNQFDDLVKDDDLHEHYTGANSGDEIGNEQEDEDRHDMISQIRKSRMKKDRMPRPA